MRTALVLLLAAGLWGGTIERPAVSCEGQRPFFAEHFYAAGPEDEVQNPWPTSPEELEAERVPNYAYGLANPGTPFYPCPDENRRLTQLKEQARQQGYEPNRIFYNGTQHYVQGYTENSTTDPTSADQNPTDGAPEPPSSERSTPAPPLLAALILALTVRRLVARLNMR